MVTGRKKFRPLVQASPLRLEQNMVFLKIAEPAYPSGGVKWVGSAKNIPFDVVGDILGVSWTLEVVPDEAAQGGMVCIFMG